MRTLPISRHARICRFVTGLRLGNIVPDFSADTTQGKWESFHKWKKGKWAVRCTLLVAVRELYSRLDRRFVTHGMYRSECRSFFPVQPTLHFTPLCTTEIGT